MFCITLNHHFWETGVEVIFSMIVSFIMLCRCGHRGNSLRPQCRYATIFTSIIGLSCKYVKVGNSTFETIIAKVWPKLKVAMSDQK